MVALKAAVVSETVLIVVLFLNNFWSTQRPAEQHVTWLFSMHVMTELFLTLQAFS